MPSSPERREIWSDSEKQWSLDEDETGALWLTVVIYDGFTAYGPEVKLTELDGKRCRKSRGAAGKLAERLFRSKGRYP